MSSRNSRNSVLVIDDDPYLRELIEAIGQTCGVTILQASDCVTGLQVLENEYRKIKMVLLDYYLPGMEPGQCASAIMAKAGRSIPVILVTAAVDPAARAAELKINRWISKPFDVSNLTSILTENTLMRKSRT